jgi:hypothetical protein
MRYRIQIQSLMGGVCCVVTEVVDGGGFSSARSKMYMVEGDDLEHSGLVEVLGQLQRLVAESTP